MSEIETAEYSLRRLLYRLLLLVNLAAVPLCLFLMVVPSDHPMHRVPALIGLPVLMLSFWVIHGHLGRFAIRLSKGAIGFFASLLLLTLVIGLADLAGFVWSTVERFQAAVYLALSMLSVMGLWAKALSAHTDPANSDPGEQDSR